MLADSRPIGFDPKPCPQPGEEVKNEVEAKKLYFPFLL